MTAPHGAPIMTVYAIYVLYMCSSMCVRAFSVYVLIKVFAAERCDVQMKDMLKRFSVTVTAVVVLIVISVLLIADNIGRAYTVSSPSLTDMPGAVIAEKKRKDEAA